MSNRVTNWYRPRVQIAPWAGSVLVQVDASLAPTLIAELEPRKSRSFYPDDAAWRVGFYAIGRQQEEYLMDIGERLIMETRAARGGDVITAQVRDPLSDPFSLPLETLAGIKNKEDAILTKMDELIAAVNASSSSDEETLEMLAQIAALLA